MRTKSEIVSDFVALIAASGLPEAVGGRVYPAGSRPRNSTAEDITVALTTATADEKLQSGVITLNVFVVNKPQGERQVVKADSPRIAEVQRVLQDWFDGLRGRLGDYVVWQRDPVGTDAIPTPTVQYYAHLRIDFTNIN